MAPSICHGGGLIPVGPNREPHDAQHVGSGPRRPLSGGGRINIDAALELDRLDTFPMWERWRTWVSWRPVSRCLR